MVTHALRRKTPAVPCIRGQAAIVAHQSTAYILGQLQLSMNSKIYEGKTMDENRVSPRNTDPTAGSDPLPTGLSCLDKIPGEEHVEKIPKIDSTSSTNEPHKKAALGFLQQQHTIPTTGKAIPTGKWEYIFFCIFC